MRGDIVVNNLVAYAHATGEVRMQSDGTPWRPLAHVEDISRAFVAALEYATGVDATVIGKPSASFFGAALAALDAEPELTWMVTDDLEQDVRGAQLFGMKTLLLRTGKFRPEALERSPVIPDAVLSSIANVPDWIDRPL